MQRPEIPATAASPAPRRVRPGGIALALSLLAIALTCPALAPARAATVARRSACPAARHARHARPSRCKPAVRRAKQVTRRTGKLSHPAAAPSHTSPGAPAAQTPALCEDSAAPVRTGNGDYACRDGSEPSCEAGGEAATGPGGAPICTAPAPASAETDEDCATSGECVSVEMICEDSPGTGEATSACESSDDGEAVS